MVIELVAPDVASHREFLDFVSGFDTEHIPGAALPVELLESVRTPTGFAAWVQRLLDHERNHHVPPDRVASTSRWIRRDGEIVGTIALRHELDDYLLHVEGGHIGYAVAPHARRLGIASEALRRMVIDAGHMGINPVLVTCSVDNVGSARVIEGQGGVLEDVRAGTRRYWITSPDVAVGYVRRPISTAPLRGRFVTLRLPTAHEHEDVLAGRVRDEWAAGFPREDDQDGMRLSDRTSPWGSRLIERRSDRRIVGSIGFFGPPDEGWGEVGYGLVESARGAGLITDALRLIVPAAEAAGVRVQAHVADDNAASVASVRRAGFVRTSEANDAGEVRWVREPGAPDTSLSR